MMNVVLIGLFFAATYGAYKAYRNLTNIVD